MSKIAFLGLGAMGSRMAAHLLAAGDSVTVWNRDAGKAIPLREAGATVAASPRAAAEGADFVISMVRDDDASRSVWLDDAGGALAAMTPGSIAIECSTLSLAWVRDFAARCANQGCALLDAPVSGSRPQAENRQLIFMVGGAAEVVERAKPILAEMGSTIHHAGPVGAGILVKLAVNGLLGIQVAALAELIGMVRRLGYDPASAVDVIAATSVCSPAAKAAASLMLADAVAPLFPVELVEKDFGYAQEAAGRPDNAPLIAAARAAFRRALDQGLGGDNMTAVARIYRDAR